MWKWQVQFSSRCETNPKSCWKKRNNYFLLKKPTYGPVSEVQRSNQLGPVVQKPINANLGLNFNPRLLCVVQS